VLGDVAAHRGQRALAARRRDGHAEARHDDGDRAAGGVRREVGDGGEAVAGQHGVEHLQVHLAQALDE
jgi:hypothetical protein